MSFDVERPLDPTPARRQRALAEGRVPRSPMLVAATSLLGGLLAVRFGGPWVAMRLSEVARRHLGGTPLLQTDATLAVDQLRGIALDVAVVLLPALVALFLLTVATNVGQVGIRWMPDRILPRFDRLVPGLGGPSALSNWSISRVAGATASIAVIVGVGAASLWLRRWELAALVGEHLPTTTSALARFVLETGLHAAYALVGLGLIDYGARWWRHEQALRMTTEELREELRHSEGAARPRPARRAALSDPAQAVVAVTVREIWQPDEKKTPHSTTRTE